MSLVSIKIHKSLIIVLLWITVVLPNEDLRHRFFSWETKQEIKSCSEDPAITILPVPALSNCDSRAEQDEFVRPIIATVWKTDLMSNKLNGYLCSLKALKKTCWTGFFGQSSYYPVSSSFIKPSAQECSDLIQHKGKYGPAKIKMGNLILSEENQDYNCNWLTTTTITTHILAVKPAYFSVNHLMNEVHFGESTTNNHLTTCRITDSHCYLISNFLALWDNSTINLSKCPYIPTLTNVGTLRDTNKSLIVTLSEAKLIFHIPILTSPIDTLPVFQCNSMDLYKSIEGFPLSFRNLDGSSLSWFHKRYRQSSKTSYEVNQTEINASTHFISQMIELSTSNSTPFSLSHAQLEYAIGELDTKNVHELRKIEEQVCKENNHVYKMALSMVSIDPEESVRMILKNDMVSGTIIGSTIYAKKCHAISLYQYQSNPECNENWPILYQFSGQEKKGYFNSRKNQIIKEKGRSFCDSYRIDHFPWNLTHMLKLNNSEFSLVNRPVYFQMYSSRELSPIYPSEEIYSITELSEFVSDTIRINKLYEYSSELFTYMLNDDFNTTPILTTNKSLKELVYKVKDISSTAWSQLRKLIGFENLVALMSILAVTIGYGLVITVPICFNKLYFAYKRSARNRGIMLGRQNIR